MILSHEHGLIFLKPRKVAGTSFEIALSRFAGDADVLTPLSPSEEEMRVRLGHAGARNAVPVGLPKRALGVAAYARRAGGRRVLKLIRQGTLHKKVPLRFYDHISAEHCRALAGRAVWERSEKLSIVRNPWDVALSLFYWREGRDADIADFGDWCARNPRIFTLNRAQYMIGDHIVVDRFLRYETLGRDIERLEADYPALEGLCRTFGAIGAKSGVRDRSRSAKSVYAAHPEADRLVRANNAMEIETFGYAGPGAAPTRAGVAESAPERA